MTTRQFRIVLHLIQWMGWMPMGYLVNSVGEKIVVGGLALFHGLMYGYYMYFDTSDERVNAKWNASENERDG